MNNNYENLWEILGFVKHSEGHEMLPHLQLLEGKRVL